MTSEEIQTRVNALQSSTVQGEEDAWQLLKPLGIGVVPHLLAAFPKFGKLQGRASLVFHSTRYARISEEAFQLGLLALHDRATLVRYQACALLAYSLRDEALPYLKTLQTHEDLKSFEDATAAIEAINSRNHHFFVDRRRTGQVTWVVNDSDRVT